MSSLIDRYSTHAYNTVNKNNVWMYVYMYVYVCVLINIVAVVL